MDLKRLIQGKRGDISVKVYESKGAVNQTDVYAISPTSYEPLRVVVDILNAFEDYGLVVENVRVGSLGSVRLINEEDDTESGIEERAHTLMTERVFDRDQYDAILALLARLPASIHGLRHFSKKQNVTWYPEEVKRGYKFVHSSGHAVGFNETLASSDNVVRIHSFSSDGSDVNVVIKFIDGGEWSDADVKRALSKHVVELWGASKYFKAYKRMSRLGAPSTLLDSDKVKTWERLHYINCRGGSSHKEFFKMAHALNINEPRHEVLRRARSEIEDVEASLNSDAKAHVDSFVQSLL